MPKAIIHSTVGQVAAELAAFDESRHVEVRVIDATVDEEQTRLEAAIRRAIDDPRPSVPADQVYARARMMVEEKKKAHGL